MIAPERKAYGFTLLELTVATAILGIALSAAMYIVVGVNSSAERVRRVGETQDTARLALDALAAEIRMSGAGASSGQIGIGTTSPSGTGTVARIPTIYAGPNITVTTAGGQKVVTNSIFIVSTEPGAGSPSSDGTGMLGSVVSSALSSTTGIQVQCTNQRGTQIDCGDSTYKSNTILPEQSDKSHLPLIVGDYVNAVYLRPTTVSAFAGTTTPQQVQFTEMGVKNAYSPDPKAPFGFARGASIGKARITHWYVKEVSPGDWQLVRSKPVLDDNWTLSGSVCNPASPFIDETNSTTGPAGTVVGSGPVENLQIRYVVDDAITDNPASFHVWGDGTNGGSNYQLGSCDILAGNGTPLQKVLREVRISVVARSRAPDHATNGVNHVKRYGLASWEGVGPSGGALDEYPRRSFEARIVPRNLQGILRL
jgi:prepilin-type N-terminal cleavage/methylation domain-containing protein